MTQLPTYGPARQPRPVGVFKTGVGFGPHKGDAARRDTGKTLTSLARSPTEDWSAGSESQARRCVTSIAPALRYRHVLLASVHLGCLSARAVPSHW